MKIKWNKILGFSGFALGITLAFQTFRGIQLPPSVVGIAFIFEALYWLEFTFDLDDVIVLKKVERNDNDQEE